MIDKNNFTALLEHLGFAKQGDIYIKNYQDDVNLKIDFTQEKLYYPENLKINHQQICSFSQAENAVVFECVDKLLTKGYKPKHIELEPKWKTGHGASGGRADILVYNQSKKPLLLIECKTYGKEFEKAWKDTLYDGAQLFSYIHQINDAQFLCLYASKYDVEQQELVREQRIIPHKDNDKIIELSDKPKTYKEASSGKRRYEVWKETYQSEYSEVGIFEDNIQPYQIGKNKYTLEIDTRDVKEQDKEGKYHRFRTILRQHNIARKETAFEVLVNLFLAKIVDEEENKNDLKFYYKGIAHDNYFDFIDRLQKLYQIGMQKFLKDEVMYISNEQIDGAFWTIRNKRNATKKQIQKYFRDLKFFSNNAFSLINVHNERSFNRNTKALVELVQMWQNLRLKTRDHNQFLGDMFEYFLDNSIKQSEGQFFTPMPITKFIVSSLPLEDKIKQSTEPLKAIDYACGAGHFLTEYAHQIRPLVEEHKQTEITHYYENITGIEKEDRLAKVAKVAAYMYGQDQIKIIEEDALSNVSEVPPASYDVLVANPPFAVEGFLLNLTDKQKENYDLIKTTKLNSNTNNIQCFFIEKAKQLMAGGGVVGVIVPSSILSNSDSMHIATREIILKYFDIVALVELGSGTFGQTGTNTVVLFLRRKNKQPEPAEHYQYRVEDYFLGEDDDANEYQDSYLIDKYCQHNQLPVADYKNLFGITPETIDSIDNLLKTEIFADYKRAFDNSTEIKNLKKKKAFKEQSRQEQQHEINKNLINYLQKIEKDKLFYFMLAFESPQKVLIVKSPDSNKKQKQFLGYEWSGAKGSEGIQYNGGSTVNDIITPLFNPKDAKDTSKINYLIEQNFLGKPPDDLSNFTEYQDLISYANIIDILDFSRTEFNKAISLNPIKNNIIETKWELVKLGDLIDITGKGSHPASFARESGNIPFIVSSAIPKKCNEYDHEHEALLFGDGGSANIHYMNNKFSASDHTYISKKREGANILLKFIYYFLHANLYLLENGFKGIGIKNISKKYIENEIKIPHPDQDIQKNIVKECEYVDNQVNKAQENIDKATIEIEIEIKRVFEKGYISKKIISVLSLEYGYSLPESSRVLGDYPVYGSNGIIGYHNSYSNTAPCIIVGRKGSAGEISWANKNCTPIDTTFFVKIFDEEELDLKYTYHILKVLNLPLMKKGSGSGGINRNNIYAMSIPVPPIDEQKELVAKIEKLEKQISDNQQIIESSTAQKQAIMDKYLK